MCMSVWLAAWLSPRRAANGIPWLEASRAALAAAQTERERERDGILGPQLDARGRLRPLPLLAGCLFRQALRLLPLAAGTFMVTVAFVMCQVVVLKRQADLVALIGAPLLNPTTHGVWRRDRFGGMAGTGCMRALSTSLGTKSC